MVDSCRECSSCLAGEEQYCDRSATVWTYNGRDKSGNLTFGGYGNHIVLDEAFALHVPQNLDLAATAPLLCAGITTYSPLRHWQAGPGKKVAIIGLGGLGHMAVKLAHAMGVEVTVLSRSLSKKDDGLKLGADYYYATENEETFEKLTGSFDLIINTVSAKIDLDRFLSLLAVDGTMVNVGAPPEPLSIQVFSLIPGRKSFAGSVIGGIPETQEMLDFCAEHGLGAEIEMINADEIDDAYERVLASDVHYRFVIDTSTI
jgi:alcohol dehydrogenase (NADP+)